MAVVEAFTAIQGTENAGMVAYYRAPGCTEVTIADVLPILSKIDYYEDEYVIGEMLIWDTGEQSTEPNNCAMVRVIVYNDGWVCAWFDKTTQNRLSLSNAAYVSAQVLSGWGSSLGYEDRYNGCHLKITATSDPDIPIDTIFTIRNTDYTNGQIQVQDNTATGYVFHSGYTYDTEIYMNNGNMVWWGVSSGYSEYPPTNSNRLYRTIYQIWDEIKYSSNSTNYSAGNASKVYMYDSQTDIYTDETIDFNDIGINDCQVLPTDEAINDAFYIGSSNKFNGVSITMGTPGVGSGIIWEYWNGSVWSVLTMVDGSSGFTTTGELTFNPPNDWETTLLNTHLLFWIRARVTVASYSTTPLLTQGQLYEQGTLTYLDIELGIYNYEFTGANYCLISGKKDTNLASDRYHYFYNTILPGKICYDYTISHGAYNYTSSSELYLNGNYISKTNGPTNGYLIFNINDIAYSVGIQNVFVLYISGTGARNKTASVLITS